MTVTDVLRSAHFVIDQEGKPTAVMLDIGAWDGAYSFMAAGAFANKDIVPFTIAEGQWATPRAVNKVGLKRAGFGAEQQVFGAPLETLDAAGGQGFR